MTPEEESDKLEAKLKEEKAAMARLQSNVAQTKETSEDLRESIDILENASHRLKKEEG
jgi:septal ring factor EnvC (AmiA/AmiB activator)